MISVLFDEVCPFCKEEIVVEMEHGIDESYECECGAAIELEYSGNLQMKAQKENKEFLSG